MPTFRLTLAYDGTDFAGWQWQPRQRTVQEEMEQAIERVTRQKTRCVSSGRTDAGVHALAQVVGFQSNTRLTGPELTKALNAELPDDMYVFDVAETYSDFHAIRDAIRKRYRYIVQDGRPRDIFHRNYLWHVYRRLDVAAMAEATKSLLGTHDFKS